MKIDFLINSLSSGGAERVMTTLANAFSEKKNDVRLITFNDNDFYKLNTNVKRVKLHHGLIKNHTIRSLINLFSFLYNKNSRPDILISFLPQNNLITIVVAKILGIKLIISEHSNHKVEVSSKIKKIRKYLYKYADFTTVLTSFDVSFYESLGAKVSVMANPIVLPNKINKFENRKKNILIAGSLNRFKLKGFDSLLHIINPILKSNPDWTLTIAGTGEKGMLKLKDIVRVLNIEEQVIFTGFCENIEELMQNSQIFILSSQYEGLPMVLMEALSNGMSCIAYDCISGPRDLITDNKNGLLIENQNAKLMRDGILKLINDDNLRKKLAENSPLSVDKYSVENIMQQWKDLILKID
ncbi:glycosyltransferase family 4 protein [uncultured Maribacter sp.]|uniref:glycosyltransferase family 4 protein n=1 Tax=uncultured Maribacter sp. TaxID=431308 RepID=UPI002605E437|nr:glycosyltransferase family 4 protein [uncultured Maribacter sp.]